MRQKRSKCNRRSSLRRAIENPNHTDVQVILDQMAYTQYCKAKDCLHIAIDHPTEGRTCLNVMEVMVNGYFDIQNEVDGWYAEDDPRWSELCKLLETAKALYK